MSQSIFELYARFLIGLLKQRNLKWWLDPHPQVRIFVMVSRPGRAKMRKRNVSRTRWRPLELILKVWRKLARQGKQLIGKYLACLLENYPFVLLRSRISVGCVFIEKSRQKWSPLKSILASEPPTFSIIISGVSKFSKIALNCIKVSKNIKTTKWMSKNMFIEFLTYNVHIGSAWATCDENAKLIILLMSL